MDKQKNLGWYLLIAGFTGGLMSRLVLVGLPAQEKTFSPPKGAEIVKLEFGLGSSQANEWKGTIRASAGEIVSIWGWRFVPPDHVAAANGWSLKTRLFVEPNQRFNVGQDLPPLNVPKGVFAAVNSADHAELFVDTNRGAFSFRLAELRAAGRLAFLGGDVAAVYLPSVHPLTRGDASQHDFPSAAVSGDEVFVAWTAFHDDANKVFLAHRDDGRWKTYQASESWGDYYGSAVALEGSGKVIVAWAEYKDDRWRLVYRRLNRDTEHWESPKYVASSGCRQMFPTMTTDANGAVWLAWQEFRDGNFDIFVASHREKGWSVPFKVSESAANDWNPSLAAAPDGTLYVSWDSYEAGNYDIFLRALRNGTLQPVIQVTQSEAYDAHSSVAVDSRNRVWLAWEQGGANWGKDTGALGGQGTFLGRGREIKLVSYYDGKFLEPHTPLSQTSGSWLSSMRVAPSGVDVSHQYPRLAIGPEGFPYIFFRQYLFRQPLDQEYLELQFAGETRSLSPLYQLPVHLWDISVVGFDGKDWTPVRRLPQSEGRCFVQTGVATGNGRLFYIWPTDGRSYGDPRPKSSQLRFLEFEGDGSQVSVGRMKPFVSEPGGVASAAPTETEDIRRVRGVRWGADKPLRLFRGDLHRHTDISLDGTNDGDILDTYRYAIDVAALDFLAVTDHSFHERQNYYHYDWWRSRQVATLFDNPGHFVTFFGYERTVWYPGGHRNVISTRRDLVPVSVSDEEHYGIESYGERLFPRLKARGDIAIAHTTATNHGTDWNVDDPVVEPIVEIFQGFRGSYEAEDTPTKSPGVAYPDGFVWSAWAKGLRLGVIASSDHQSTHQSYACVYAPEFTADSIHEAMKRRRTFAATDNIVLKFDALLDGEVYKMGEEFVTDSFPEFRVEIEGTAPLKTVEMIRNNRILFSRSPGSSRETFTYKDTGAGTGVKYYYVRAVQANDQIAWSSPIWVRLQER